MDLCSQCDVAHAAADCPHRQVLAGPVSTPLTGPRPSVPVRASAIDRDTDWDREKGRWW